MKNLVQSEKYNQNLTPRKNRTHIETGCEGQPTITCYGSENFQHMATLHLVASINPQLICQ
ncbi:hypothetical protein C1H46_006964 [Malus baccata]|uniref:Uncharacterized protein n=1 Tax=Malus baccata TaxID=106549 RepID=A0A540N8E4_MALBA|nr:hypothetical protein C1H46_006964 [Malus baccata]